MNRPYSEFARLATAMVRSLGPGVSWLRAAMTRTNCPAPDARASTLIKTLVTALAYRGAVTRVQKLLVLIAVIAVPAAAHSTFAPKQSPCFASGAATYQIAPNASSPDYRVRIAGDALRPDLRMQLVDRAEIADFVLVDDFGAAELGACRSATPFRTVKLDADTHAPDVTVNLSADAAGTDYKIYVHSVRFSQQDAAALLAAMWKANQHRELAASTVH